MKSDKMFKNEQLILSNIEYLYAFAFQLTANRQDAEDMVQDTILTGLQKIGQLNDINKVKSWLRKICFNIFLQKERKLRNVVILPDDEILKDYQGDVPTPEDEIIVDETVRDIRNGCFTSMAVKLSHGQRTVFVLSEMFGLAILEISSLMDISASAVKALLYRARKNMNAFFGHHCEWVLSENHCKCKAWAEFIADRDKLKKAVRKHGAPPDFNDPAYSKKSDPLTMGKVMALFRQIPHKKPSGNWYQKVSDIIKHKLSDL